MEIAAPKDIRLRRIPQARNDSTLGQGQDKGQAKEFLGGLAS